MGLFNYYTFKQLPNFLLALPMIIISFTGIISYISNDLKRFLTLGLITTPNSKQPFYSPKVTVFIFHWLFILITALTVLHVQVTTRFIASQCIPFYWWTATILSTTQSKYQHNTLLLYLYSYIMIGTSLYTNFLPWT